ncbi:HTTM domain-containing protein [Kineosporia mesophila]|uniref:HTTM domain-containing protein n=1 Tax=Kineosporia mesophila TaxID=566012 RepID=A0ABP7AQ11_9ACTN|nr:hypothetical protein [Kineosporia mesophila]MCD5349138.1 hypothetical protein [Kineosporia mesophila]
MTAQAAVPVAGEPPAGSVPSPAERLRGWVFTPVPLARVALMRVVVYLFVVYDLFYVVNDPPHLAQNSAVLYRPIRIRTWLDLPTPSSGYVLTERAVVIAACALVITGVLLRLPRWLTALAGVVVAAGFTDWVSIGMSYSKVDHDHFALIMAVWVLPTVGTTLLRGRGAGLRSEAAGWALLCIQVGCVATYFLSAVAKVRYGGWDWVTGSTFAWAMTRRGTGLGRALLDPPWILTASQFLIFAIEVCSPVILWARGRVRYLMVLGFMVFHLSTYLAMKIHFLPLVICLLAFLPLEIVLQRREKPVP